MIDSNRQGFRESTVFGVLTLLIASYTGFLSYGLDASMAIVLACPMLAAGCVLLRWRILKLLLPVAIFAPFVLGGLTLRTYPTTGDPPLRTEAVMFAGCSLLLLVVSQRFSAATSGQQVTRLVTDRFNYSPVAAATDLPRRFGLQDWVSLGLISLACILGAWICRPLNQQMPAVPHVAVLPEAYFGIKFCLFGAVVVWCLRTVLDYLRTMFDRDRDLASMHLRSELWKWNGSDQRMIGKQTAKSERLQ